MTVAMENEPRAARPLVPAANRLPFIFGFAATAACASPSPLRPSTSIEGEKAAPNKGLVLDFSPAGIVVKSNERAPPTVLISNGLPRGSPPERWLPVQPHDGGWLVPAAALGEYVYAEHAGNLTRPPDAQWPLTLTVDIADTRVELDNEAYADLLDVWECATLSNPEYFPGPPPILTVYGKRVQPRCEEGGKRLRRFACDSFKIWTYGMGRGPVNPWYYEPAFELLEDCGDELCHDFDRFVGHALRSMWIDQATVSMERACQAHESPRRPCDLDAVDEQRPLQHVVALLHVVSGFERRCPDPDAHAEVGEELRFAFARGVYKAVESWRTTLAFLDTIARIAEHVPDQHRAVVDAEIDEAIATVSLGEDCRTERDRADAGALLSAIEGRLGKRSRTARRITRELRRCHAKWPRGQ
jgi:hypothetical protein